MLQPLWLPRSPASFIRVFFQLFCHQVCYQGVLQNIFNRRSAIILMERNYQQVTLQPRNIMARDSLARPTPGRNQLRAIQQEKLRAWVGAGSPQRQVPVDSGANTLHLPLYLSPKGSTPVRDSGSCYSFAVPCKALLNTPIPLVWAKPYISHIKQKRRQNLFKVPNTLGAILTPKLDHKTLHGPVLRHHLTSY